MRQLSSKFSISPDRIEALLRLKALETEWQAQVSFLEMSEIGYSYVDRNDGIEGRGEEALKPSSGFSSFCGDDTSFFRLVLQTIQW